MFTRFIPTLGRKKFKQQYLKELSETGARIRAEIDKKMNEVKAVDQQLNEAITDTKKLTHDITAKLNTRLKITRNSLKSIMRNLRDGIVMLDYSGRVIEMNLASFKVKKDQFIGLDFNDLAANMGMTVDGDCLHIKSCFFEDLSIHIFDKSCKHADTDCDCSDCPVPLEELEQYLHTTISLPESVKLKTGSGEHVKCSLNFKIFDNSPSNVQDVTYVLFFKCLQRASDVKADLSELTGRHSTFKG